MSKPKCVYETKPPSLRGSTKEFCTFEWEKIFLIPHLCVMETYLKCFLYKVIQNILAVNYKLFKWKILWDNHCSYCNHQPETVHHLFVSCDRVSQFWAEFVPFINQFSQKQIVATNEEKLLGQLDGELLTNYIICNPREIFYLRV
jgi:hypothetical protein